MNGSIFYKNNITYPKIFPSSTTEILFYLRRIIEILKTLDLYKYVYPGLVDLQDKNNQLNFYNYSGDKKIVFSIWFDRVNWQDKQNVIEFYNKILDKLIRNFNLKVTNDKS